MLVRARARKRDRTGVRGEIEHMCRREHREQILAVCVASVNCYARSMVERRCALYPPKVSGRRWCVRWFHPGRRAIDLITKWP